MLTINYRAIAKSRIHHGDDKKTGNIKLFRREEIALHPDLRKRYESNFKDEETKRQAIIAILKCIFKSISNEWKSKHYKVIWNQFTARCYSAAIQSDNQFTFLTTICQMFDITTPNNPSVIRILGMFQDREFNETLIDELQYLIAFLRVSIQEDKKRKKEGEEKQEVFSFLDENEISEAPNLVFEKKFDRVPFISGNSIGGLLRRLLIYDFCKRIGIKRDIFVEKNDDILIDRDIYHQLMTGGNITENTEFEDIDFRENFLRMCPPIALLGSAVGNMTIRGRIAIGDMQLECREMLTGDEPYYRFLSVDFGTRQDTEKHETEIGINNRELKAKTTPQMIYYHEVISKGSVFDHWYKLETDSEVLISCFWRGVKLFKDTPFFGAKRKAGLGLMELDIAVPKDAEKPYLNYLENNKEKMLKYFAMAEDVGD